MFRNSFLAITLFILWTCVGTAMQTTNTTINPEQKIKPFANKQETQQAFMELIIYENILWKKGFRRDSCEKYQEKILYFYQRLFRTLVKADIKQKLEYTIALGLKNSADGDLTMELLPVAWEDVIKRNTLLLILSIDQTNKEALNELKKIEAKRANPSKSADSFFPKIVPLDNNKSELSTEITATYSPIPNLISLRKKDLSIMCIDTIIHEFTHKRQTIQGTTANGGIYYGLLDTEAPYNKYPIEIALELEAEFYSVREHPLPTFSLVTLKHLMNEQQKTLGNDALKYTCKQFPYISFTERYTMTRTFFNLNSDKNSDISADKHTNQITRKWGHIIATCLYHYSGEKNGAEINYPMCLKIIQKGRKLAELFENKTKIVKNLLLKNEKLSEKKKEKIINTPNYRSGDKSFFALQQKLGFIPKISVK